MKHTVIMLAVLLVACDAGAISTNTTPVRTVYAGALGTSGSALHCIPGLDPAADTPAVQAWVSDGRGWISAEQSVTSVRLTGECIELEHGPPSGEYRLVVVR
jgi:hypothetical protein